ncbi:MAG: transposase [Pyrinomonadaceae bacterium]
MWNDTETPLAYFISFRCYGTWLRGDERGSIDRFHNEYGSPYIPQNDALRNHHEGLMKGDPVKLDAKRRNAVSSAIRDTCAKRGWELLAYNVRTNHVHTVVCGGSKKSSLVLNAFKANATRQLREEALWTETYSPWADKGSRRRLWNEQSVARAIDYVVNGQSNDLPNFD